MWFTKYETVFLNLILVFLFLFYFFYFFNFLVENQTTVRFCVMRKYK